MSYWHLFGGPISWPVYVNGEQTGWADGIAEGLVGPVDRPPIEDDYIDEETGERYEHVASWSRPPTAQDVELALAARFPDLMKTRPLLSFTRSVHAGWKFS